MNKFYNVMIMLIGVMIFVVASMFMQGCDKKPSLPSCGDVLSDFYASFDPTKESIGVPINLQVFFVWPLVDKTDPDLLRVVCLGKKDAMDKSEKGWRCVVPNDMTQKCHAGPDAYEIFYYGEGVINIKQGAI